MEKIDRLLNIRQVVEITGFQKSSIYNKTTPGHRYFDPSFPQRVNNGRGMARWRESEVNAWVQSRPYLLTQATSDTQLTPSKPPTQHISPIKPTKISKKIQKQSDSFEHSQPNLTVAQPEQSVAPEITPAPPPPIAKIAVEQPVASAQSTGHLIAKSTKSFVITEPIRKRSHTIVLNHLNKKSLPATGLDNYTSALSKKILAELHPADIPSPKPSEAFTRIYGKKDKAVSYLEENAKNKQIVNISDLQRILNISDTSIKNQLALDKLLLEICWDSYHKNRIFLGCIVRDRGCMTNPAFGAFMTLAHQVHLPTNDPNNLVRYLTDRVFDFYERGTLV